MAVCGEAEDRRSTVYRSVVVTILPVQLHPRPHTQQAEQSGHTPLLAVYLVDPTRGRIVSTAILMVFYVFIEH